LAALAADGRKTIGVIGGMGPMATVDIFRKIILCTDAAGDGGHIPVLVDNNTRIPDRTEAIMRGGPDPAPELLRSAARLAGMGADLLLMPCNAAHYYYDAIRRSVAIPLLNMVEETAAEAARLRLGRVGLLAVSGTLHAGLYDRAFAARNIRVLKPDEREQEAVMTVVYAGVKAGNFAVDRSDFLALTRRLYAAGAEALVLACTELPLLFAEWDVPGRVLDPALILARQGVLLAGGKLKQ
jgi:aspartate racemase